MVFWAALSAAAVIIVLLSNMATKRHAFSDRDPLELDEIHGTVRESVTLDTLCEVWTAVGRAYSVDPRLLRADDPIAKCNDLDSWRLWKGTDDLDRWLQSVGVRALTKGVGTTLLELARLVEDAKPSGRP